MRTGTTAVSTVRRLSPLYGMLGSLRRFETMDKDSSGSVDYNELKRVMDRLPPRLPLTTGECQTDLTVEEIDNWQRLAQEGKTAERFEAENVLHGGTPCRAPRQHTFDEMAERWRIRFRA